MPVHHQEAGLKAVLDAIKACLKAADNAEGLTARVADLLLDYAGPLSANGVRNGSEKKLHHVANEVKSQFGVRAGSFSSLGYLRDLRSTAQKFPPAERYAGVSFSWMICFASNRAPSENVDTQS